MNKSRNQSSTRTEAPSAPKLIILDRDGVINVDSPHFIKSVEEWIPIPGSLSAIAALCKQGFTVCIATNQSGVARGLFSLDTLNQIHEKMQAELAKLGGKIDSIFYCAHLPDAGCSCRKPKPGLLEQIADHYQIDLKELQANDQMIPCVGDSLRDLLAAESASCLPILVLTGNGQKTKTELPASLKKVECFENLQAFVNSYLGSFSDASSRTPSCLS